jgi:hypothetical protein
MLRGEAISPRQHTHPLFVGMRSALLVLAALLVDNLCLARTAEEKETALKAVRMKTTRQLKEIFDELGIDHAGLAKQALRKKAYKENAVERWEELHPEKKKPKRPAGGGGGGGGIPGMDFGGGGAPEGMDPGKWEDLMAQMRGDFSHEKDPERRRLLEKLNKNGMSFGGGNNMDTEQLRNLEKVMDGMKGGGFGGGAGGPGPDVGTFSSGKRGAESTDDESIADEDKIEL